MILYTPLPHELVFRGEEKGQKEMVVRCKGIPVAVRRETDDRWKISRIVSTNPYHYLSDEVKPGAYVAFREKTSVSLDEI
jgi:hypothetical protein